MTSRTYSLQAEAKENPALRSLLVRPITFSRTEGSRHSVEGWRTEHITLGELVTECAQPSLVGPKVFCPAVLSDRWRDPLTANYTDFAVVESRGVILDDLVGRLQTLNLSGLVQAREAHLRTSTIIKQCELDCWYAGRPDADAMEWVLAHELHVETEVHSVEPTTHEGCPAHLVIHEPVEAYRLILPLEDRFEFVIADSVWHGLELWDVTLGGLHEALDLAAPAADLAPTRAFEMQTSDALVAWSAGELLAV